MRALICGVSGQDGTYLSKFLLEKGYEVYGTSRDHLSSSFNNLVKLKLNKKIILSSMDPEDFISVFKTFSEIQPDEVYFLAGQSSVGLSYEQPAETLKSITIGTLNILEACKNINDKIKVYFAGSSEVFGNTNDDAANETTKFLPKSPYGVAKAASFWTVKTYRDAYNLKVCTGILFNHESPLRHERFVTKKIVKGAWQIKKGLIKKLELGRLDVNRDWGYAPEYVEAMWLMLQNEKMDDFIISTGKYHSLEKFVELVFKFHDLDWKKYVVINNNLKRPTDIAISYGDSSKAKNILNWEARCSLQQIVNIMCNEFES